MASMQTHTLIKLAILIAALALILAGLYLVKHYGESRRTKLVDYVLVGLAGLSLLNFYSFMPFSNRPHYHDMFHYYLGAKYFPEIGYSRLYACAVKAEAESDDLLIRALAFDRDIRNLQTDIVVPARPYILDDTFCKARFSPPRWNEFKSDVGFFHSRVGIEKTWGKNFLDYGFNPSPVWELGGGFVSNLKPLSDQSLMWLKQIDIVFMFGSVACLVWAFGLPTAAFAVIAFTALEAVNLKFCGNSLLRFDWFFLVVLSVSAMKRGYHILAGLALGYAVALRVFPAVFALGPFVGLLYAVYKRQYDLKMAYAKFFGGLILSIAVLVACASTIYGGESMRTFFDNSKKHSKVIATNNVGLLTALTYNFDTSLRETLDGRSSDQFEPWRAAKIEARKKVVLKYAAVVAVALLFFTLAVMSGGAWQALALGASFVPFAWVEVANYYYVFIAVTATLFFSNRKVAFPLLGIGIVSAICELSHQIVEDKVYALFADEVYTIFSVVVCIGYLIVWWQIRRGANPGLKLRS